MKQNVLVRFCLLVAAFLGGLCYAGDSLPNVVLLFVDDMGYADIGPFGCDAYETPHLDQMAAEGRRFTDFHAATAVCSASRAALLTGCYPERVSIQGALFPGDRHGLNPEETTLAELCKSRGYATACFGKWHLGDLPEFMPLRQGFDEYFGLPYSNDMWPYLRGETTLDAGQRKRKGKPFPPLPLYDGEEIVDANVTPAVQAELTVRYTEQAVDFIHRKAGNEPFFLYVPYTMVHVPLFVSERFRGKSGAGLYGDVVMELDWSVGQILSALREKDVDRETLVVFTSDNGPWLSFGNHGGSAGALREGKGTMFEGGHREPCIMRWPGQIPAGTTCDELTVTFDLLPTVAKLIGADLAERQIDGKDISELMTDDEERSPHEIFYCYYGNELRAVRDRRWKLHLPHTYQTLAGRPGGTGGKPSRYDIGKIGQELYDLKSDPGETTDVAANYPEEVARLLRYAEIARADLGDKLTGAQGANLRARGESPLPVGAP